MLLGVECLGVRSAKLMHSPTDDGKWLNRPKYIPLSPTLPTPGPAPTLGKKITLTDFVRPPQGRLTADGKKVNPKLPFCNQTIKYLIYRAPAYLHPRGP